MLFSSTLNIEAQEEANPFISNQPVNATNHRFGIKFHNARSTLNYNVAPEEIAAGIVAGTKPNIIIVGSLSVNSLDSAAKCVVKLPSPILKAENEFGDVIEIQLSGTIGDKRLSTEFIHPNFDALNEAQFRIEGFIDPRSYKNGLSPGSYKYQENLNLIVEFHD